MNRGVVIKLFGDARIAGAIADGMARALPQEQVEIVEAEIDRQNIQRSLLRVAVNNTKSAADYACMAAKARYEYDIPRRHGQLYGAVMGMWGLLWLVVYSIYDYMSVWNREA